MKEHIHTIPVLEALKEPGNCAFCAMKKKLEDGAIRFIMGPAYMEDDVRMKTNKTGFCKKHMDAMYEAGNRLGLALMLHTHVMELGRSMDSIPGLNTKPSFFAQSGDLYLSKLVEYLEKTNNLCYICEYVDSTFERYVETFFMLWSKGGPEAQLINSQKGYCLPHFRVVLMQAAKLGGKKRSRFMEEILPVWLKHIKQLEEDLDWFTQKFDYRNKDADWKNSKDALPRAVAILGGEA